MNAAERYFQDRGLLMFCPCHCVHCVAGGLYRHEVPQSELTWLHWEEQWKKALGLRRKR